MRSLFKYVQHEHERRPDSDVVSGRIAGVVEDLPMPVDQGGCVRFRHVAVFGGRREQYVIGDHQPIFVLLAEGVPFLLQGAGLPVHLDEVEGGILDVARRDLG